MTVPKNSLKKIKNSELKRKMEKSIVIAGDFNMLLSANNRTTTQKSN